MTTRLGNLDDSNFREIEKLIKESDVRFTNLETTVHDSEGTPGAFSGGTWAMSNPNILKDLEAYGFNLLNIANNHTLDYLYDGLALTEANLKRYDFVYAGAGENMAKASRPKYLDTPSGRVGFIAATSSFQDFWIAGEQRRDMKGRPGINPLRHEAIYVVSKENIERLKEIADSTDINAMNNLNFKEGFDVRPDSKYFKFGDYTFMEGDEEGLVTRLNEKDMERIERSILEAKRQADEVIVSIHSHEMKGEDKSQPADFLIEFAHKCIDAGATAVLGHGPHILRGIEIYKDRPIFYSLGNFIFQSDLVEFLPSDFYKKFDLEDDNNTADAFDKRSRNNTVGLGVNPLVWESIIAQWKIEEGKLKEISLYPIDLGFDVPRYSRGFPSLSKNTKVLKDLIMLSEPFGTRIEVIDKVGKVVIP